jgi:predicted dehydrogenase
MIDAAIVGLGRWGRTLVEAVQGKSEKIRFTRAVSRDPAQHRDFLETHHLLAGGDFAAMLSDRSVKAVVLATPHTRHAAEVAAAAAAGKAVFCEKPLALSRAETARAIGACRDAGVVLGIGTDKRYFSSIAETIRLVDSGELGPLLHVEGNFSNEVAAAFAAWRGDPAESPAGGMTPRPRCADPSRRPGKAPPRATLRDKAWPRSVGQPVGAARIRERNRRHAGGGAFDAGGPPPACVCAKRLG